MDHDNDDVQRIRHQKLIPDPIKEGLEAISRRLARPDFLKEITPSRLPSQAASDASLSPGEAPRRKARSSFGYCHHKQNKHCIEDKEQPCIEKTDVTIALLETPSSLDAKELRLDLPVSNEDQLRFIEGYRAFIEMMASERNFQTIGHGHQDNVLAVDINYFGNRMVTASSDHRIKIWDRKDDSWVLTDSWRAHDAEIVDAKWNGPFMGEVIGSIGEDGRCKIWQEDVTEVPMSGRRFKLITNIGSQTSAPYMSMDFKNIMQETWLALITRDGRLNVYEPTDSSNLCEWSLLAEHWVCENNQPDRQEEVGFKVCFHKEKLPCWTACAAGLDRKSIGLAVAAMRNVLVFRTDKAKRFYLAAELKGARQVIRDLAWANGSVRGYDTLATASKDGVIRIYDLSTPRSDNSSTNLTLPSSTHVEQPPSPRPSGPRKNAPSGIGAGLAGASKVSDSGHDHEQQPGRVKQKVKLAAELAHHHGAVWRVAFSQNGDLLITTGDDASIRSWKKKANGAWLEYAEIESAQY